MNAKKDKRELLYRTAVICLLLVLLFGNLLIRHALIQAGQQYPRHIDEPPIAKAALNIVKTGNFNPHFFDYPSLPIYITTVGVIIGYLDACRHNEVTSLNDIVSVSYPYHTNARILFPARLIFTAFGVLTLGLIGLLAFKIKPSLHLLLVAPLFLMVSVLFLNQSYLYLNVDLLGCFFVLLAIVCIVYFEARWSLFYKAVLPGIMCGLATASKYNLCIVVIPCLLAIFWNCPKQEYLKLGAILFLSTFCTFLLMVPYSLLDLPGFVESLGSVLRHYSSGHAGHEGKPGVGQTLFYLKALFEEFGAVLFVLAIVGAVHSLFWRWKASAYVLVFSMVQVVLMSQMKVTFVRNILPLFVFFAMFAALGFESVSAVLSEKARRVWSMDKRKIILFNSAVRVLLIGLILFSIPWKSTLYAYGPQPDSRNLAVDWIIENIPAGSRILIPIEADLDARKIAKPYRVTMFALHNWDDALLQMGEHFYLVKPVYGYDTRKPEGKEIANLWNDRLEKMGGQELVRFGVNEPQVNYMVPIPSGNPLLLLMEVSPDSSESTRGQSSLHPSNNGPFPFSLASVRSSPGGDCRNRLIIERDKDSALLRLKSHDIPP